MYNNIPTRQFDCVRATPGLENGKNLKFQLQQADHPVQVSQDETDMKHLCALPERYTHSQGHKNLALYKNLSVTETKGHQKLLWQSSLGSKVIPILKGLFTVPSGQKNGIWMEKAITAYFSDITELSCVICVVTPKLSDANLQVMS